MQFKVALALGGGGVRGFAHIGVLKVLKENNFPIDLIVGSSMGTIVGGAFCLYQDVDFLKQKVREVIHSKEIKELESFLADSEPQEKKIIIGKFLNLIKEIYLWNIKRTKKWLVESQSLIDLIKRVIPQDARFSDTKIPFACVATDLLSGQNLILKEGRLLEAVLASCSIPGIFPPVKINNRLLVDGGIVSLVPSLCAKRLGADFIIGVNVEGLRLKDNFRSGMDILFQTDRIMAHHLNRANLSQCDFVISPEISSLSWADFSKADYCIQKGIEATQRHLPQLKQSIRKMKFKSYLRRLLRPQRIN